MRTISLVLVILMSMRMDVQAQVACPVSSAVDFWTGTTLTSSFLFTTYTDEVEINGTLEVNTSLFTFDGAEVGFKAFNSKIVVNPSCTLRIINGSILTNLDPFNRWQGIEVLPGGRLEVDGSEICGSQDAIQCNNSFSTGAAEFDVRNSFLRFNETGISLTNFTGGPYPGIVYNTHFQGGSMPSMSPPYSINGVKAGDIDPVTGPGLQIGELTSTTTPNLFTDLEYGIQVFNTTLEVFNSEFESIQDLSGLGTGYAVFAADRTPGSYYLGVGFYVGSGSAFVGNTMKDCLHGVYVTGYETVVINNNTMTAPTDSFRTGITVERTRLEISVLNNEIRQFGKLGILLDDNPGLGGGTGVDAAVSNNVIRGENRKTKAIFVDELVGSIMGGITMKGNVIDRVWRGIGVQSSAGTINSRDNVVDFRYPGTGVTSEPAAGIYVLSSAEALLLRNTISGNCPVPSGGGPCNSYTVANAKVRGIQLNQTFKTAIYNNDIQYSGAGVYVQGPNFEGNMVCNDFFDNYTAVLWDNLPTDGFGVTTDGSAIFTNRVQGLGTLAPHEDWSENTFTSSVPTPPPFRSWSINGADAGSVDWFYQSAPTFDFPGGTIGLVSLTALAPTVGDPTIVCSTLLLADTSEGSETIGYTELTVSEEELNNMIRARTSTGDLEDIYAQLSAWHQIGLSSAVLDSLLNLTSIREFEQVQSFWLEGDLVAIEAKLATINPAVPLETLLKKVWEIQLAATQTGSSSSGTYAFSTDLLFSPIDREVLQAIALDTVSSHTQAMYKAQSLLEWSILGDRWLPIEEESRIASLTGKSSPVKLYPNPAQHSATIESGQPIATIKLYDLKGLLVKEADAGGVLTFVLDLKTIAR